MVSTFCLSHRLHLSLVVGKHVVFGKVIRGYDDVVKKLAQVPVDEKSRPQVPIVIVNCGELELRKSKPVESAKRRSCPCLLVTLDAFNLTASAKAQESDKGRKRRNDRSRSRSPRREKERRRRKKLKRTKSEESEESEKPSNEAEKSVVQEAAEEYDARLEREERERIEATKRKELERIKEMHERACTSQGGVRFKGMSPSPINCAHFMIFVGRGRMKFVDPELYQRP